VSSATWASSDATLFCNGFTTCVVFRVSYLGFRLRVEVVWASRSTLSEYSAMVFDYLSVWGL